MTRSLSGNIPDISGTSREYKDSKRNAVTSRRGTEANTTKGSKCAPQLQPIKREKRSRLPPLKEDLLPGKENRLPDICFQTKKPTRVLDRTPEVLTPTCAGSESQKRHVRSSTKLEDYSDTDDDSYNSKYALKEFHHTAQNLTESSDKYTYYGHHDDDVLTLHSIKNKKERPTWFEEREKLRQYKRQVEKKQTYLKPLKATQTFKEKKPKNGVETSNEVDGVPRNETPGTKPSLQRRHRDIFNKQRADSVTEFHPPSTPNITSGYTDSHRACALGPLTPRGGECSKKGVGFVSKTRLTKLKADEEERLEKERKEREKKEARIPRSIRKDFKKYGFK